jgi:hypothetical protein
VTDTQVPRAGSNRPPAAQATTTMATARVILRSCNTRRNIHRVLSGQVRCLHATTEKPVFRWEVSPPASTLCNLFQKLNPALPGSVGHRGSIIRRGNRYSVRAHSCCHVRSPTLLKRAQRHGTGLLSSTYFFASAVRYCLIDASAGVSRATSPPGTPNRRCVLVTHISDHIIYACMDFR